MGACVHMYIDLNVYLHPPTHTHTHTQHIYAHTRTHACMGAQVDAGDGVANNALLHCSLLAPPQHMDQCITLEEDD